MFIQIVMLPLKKRKRKAWKRLVKQEKKKNEGRKEKEMEGKTEQRRD